MINRQEMNKKLPYGYRKQVAKRAEVSIQTVSRYLNGKQNSERVENSVLEILAEISSKKKELLDKIF